MGTNLLSNISENDYYLFKPYLTAQTEDKPYYNEADVKKITDMYFNTLSFLNQNQGNNTNLKQLENTLKRLGMQSLDKEIEVYKILGGEDDFIKDIKAFVIDSFNSKELRKKGINPGETLIKKLNLLFWGIKNEEDDRYYFLENLSNLKSQNFFIRELEGGVLKAGDSAKSNLPLDMNWNELYKTSIEQELIAEIENETSPLGKKIAGDFKNNNFRASIGALKAAAGRISKHIAKDIEQQLKDETNKLLLNFGDLNTDKATILQRQAKSAYFSYTIVTSKNSQNELVHELRADLGTAFNVGEFSKVLETNIITELSKKNKEFASVGWARNFFKRIAQKTLDSLEINLEKPIEISQKIFEEVNIESNPIVKEFEDYFLKDTSGNLSYDNLQKKIDSFDKHISKEIDELINKWFHLLEFELASSSRKNSNVQSERALKYFTKIKPILEQEIKSDISPSNKDYSALHGEIIRAVVQYFNLGHKGNAGNIALFNGTIGEIFTTILLRMVLKDRASSDMNWSVYQKGSSLQEGKQATADIEINYGNKDKMSKYGIQVKQYANNKIDLYGEEQAIKIKNATRYLTQDEINSFLFMMTNERTFIKTNIRDSGFGANYDFLLPFLYYRLDGFLRYKHAAEDIKDSIQNNFYIFNFNVIPASFIFLFYLYKIEEENSQSNSYFSSNVFKLSGIKNIKYPNEDYFYYSFEDNLVSELLKKYIIIFKGKTININDEKNLFSLFK